MKTIHFLFIVLSISINLFSQSVLYQKGESGFGVGSNLALNKDATGVSGSLSYTFNGTISVGGQLGVSTADEGDLSALGIGPYFVFYPLKYTSELPLSIAIAGGYTFTNYSSKILDQFKIDMTGSTLGLSGSLFAHLGISDKIQIIPGLSYEYDIVKVKMSDNYGNSIDDDENFSYLSLSFDIGIKASQKLNVLFGPSVTFGVGGEGNNGNTIGLHAGFGFR